MRFPRAALVFLVTAFVFFAMYGISSRLITEVNTATAAYDTGYSSEYQDIKSSIPPAFGLIAVIFFVMTIIAFIMESLGEEYEYYPTRRQR